MTKLTEYEWRTHLALAVQRYIISVLCCCYNHSQPSITLRTLDHISSHRMHVLSAIHFLVLFSGIAALPLRINNDIYNLKSRVETGPPSWKRDLSGAFPLPLPSPSDDDSPYSFPSPWAQNEVDEGPAPPWKRDDSRDTSYPPSWEGNATRQDPSPPWIRGTSESVSKAAPPWKREVLLEENPLPLNPENELQEPSPSEGFTKDSVSSPFRLSVTLGA
ncbi:hypothetical protein DFH05DRAFT_1488747 [Lentinula detonsa]|uniref:Uncharacterized protein n=1 Tax=Lentinula detonsa TaxID=2804962 RepID=A0A9W8P2K1_9AGAR|nr:hypothetical protein DFH05DRAFT_1488747 [Lentinula detonsa]